MPQLRALRLDRALTQEDLAHLAGVSRATISRGEALEELRISSVQRLARALKVPPAKLMHE